MHLSYAYLPDFSDVKLSGSKDFSPQSSISEPLYLWPSLALEPLTGRKELVSSIQEALVLKRSHQSRLALHGLGGVGKTQIALQLIQWYRLCYPSESIFWIHGGSSDILQQSLTEIALRRQLLARKDAITESLDAVHNFLINEDNGRWLMIVDNADNPDTFFKNSSVSPEISSSRMHEIALGTYIPICLHGRIIFTTNNKALGEKLSMRGSVIEIPHLTLAEACQLLQTRLFDNTDSEESPPSYQREVPGKTDLEKLCGYLDRLPLALTQAAAFMRQQNVTVSEYIQLLDDDETRLSDLLAHNFQASGREDDFSKAIASTWNVTFDRILRDVPIAAELLSLMAFLDSKDIPKSLLKHLVSNEWDLTVTGLGTLQSYGLVSLSKEHDKISIHRLVQHAMRKRLASDDAAIKWSRKALSMISEHFPDGKYESWETCAALLPHASHVLKNESEDKQELLLIGTLQFKIGQYYFKTGFYSQATQVSLEALDTLAQLPDAPKNLVYKAKSLRADALRHNSQLQEAEDLAKEVWYERQNELGAKHVDTLESYAALAMMYQEQGKYKEGVKAARHILKRLRKTLKEDDPVIQAVKRRLGSLLHYLGEYSEAETVLREAIDVRATQLDPDDNALLKTKWRLAWVLHDQGKYQLAEQMTFEIWTAQKRTIGELHPDTLKSLFLYADDLQAQSKFEDAINFKRHVHTQAATLVGSNHRYTWMAGASLASCLVASVPDNSGPCSEYDEASELYKDVLERRQESLLPDHPETLSARTGVATMLRLNGSVGEAEIFERETLKKAKVGHERHHPIVLESRESLARILWAQKESQAKAKEAVEQMRKVLKMKEKSYGWSYIGTRNTAALLVEMLPDGKEKEGLREKIRKSAAAVLADDATASQESLGKRKVSASAEKGGADLGLEKKGEEKKLHDAWFKPKTT